MEVGVKYARRSFWKKLIFDSFDLREVFWELQKIGAFELLSRNPTLTKRCEVNKINLVIYFSIQEKCSSHLFMGRFSLEFPQRIKGK